MTLTKCKVNGLSRMYQPQTIGQLLKRYQDTPDHVILNGEITKDFDYLIREKDSIEWKPLREQV